jgi:hypothetical protein
MLPLHTADISSVPASVSLSHVCMHVEFDGFAPKKLQMLPMISSMRVSDGSPSIVENAMN